MKFVIYIDREGSTWPPPDRPPGEPLVIEVDPDTRFEDAVTAAIHNAGPTVEDLYEVGEGRLFYVPMSLRNAEEPNSELVAFPRVVISDDGQFLWMWGARDRATFADLERARGAGYFEGDPLGVFLERPMYGDGVIPGWEDFLGWLGQAAVGGLGALFVGVIRKHFKRWQDRGAVTPYAFLDIVVARGEWDRRSLSLLLGLSEQETTELLTSMGFEAQQDDPEQWTVSKNPEASSLRRRILEDFLHRHPDGGDEEEEDRSG